MDANADKPCIDSCTMGVTLTLWSALPECPVK